MAIAALTYADFLSKELPVREMLLAPWLPSQGLAMIHAARGVGKTYAAVGTGWAVACGSRFLKWQAPTPRRVLLIDGEMPGRVLQERVALFARGPVQPPNPDYFRICAADLDPNGLPDLADPDSHKFYAPVLEGAELIVVDNLSTLCRGLKENDADTFLPVQSWALSQRRAGRSVVLIHHDGKNGSQRGTSRKEDTLDTVIALRRPPDYAADQGARFEIHFEKSRGFYGRDAEPFEAQIINGEWSMRELKAGADPETIIGLSRAGFSVREIEKRTGVSKSKVDRILKSVSQQ